MALPGMISFENSNYDKTPDHCLNNKQCINTSEFINAVETSCFGSSDFKLNMDKPRIYTEKESKILNSVFKYAYMRSLGYVASSGCNINSRDDLIHAYQYFCLRVDGITHNVSTDSYRNFSSGCSNVLFKDQWDEFFPQKSSSWQYFAAGATILITAFAFSPRLVRLAKMCFMLK